MRVYLREEKKSPRKSFTTSVGVCWLLQADQRMFHVSGRRQKCCNASSNNCRLCSPRFKCPLRFMTSVQRGWRNWLPTLHTEPFIELCGSKYWSKYWFAYKYWFAHAKRTHRIMLDSYFCDYMKHQRHKNDDLFEQVLADIAVFWPPV